MDWRREHYWRSHWPVELSSERRRPVFSTASAEHVAPHGPQTSADQRSQSGLVMGESSEAPNPYKATVLKMVHLVEAFDWFKIATPTGQIIGIAYILMVTLLLQYKPTNKCQHCSICCTPLDVYKKLKLFLSIHSDLLVSYKPQVFSFLISFSYVFSLRLNSLLRHLRNHYFYYKLRQWWAF